MEWRTWWFCKFDKAKCHVVPEVLRDRLIVNMADRGCPVFEPHKSLLGLYGPAIHETIESHICLRGARREDDTIMVFDIGDLLVHMYAADVGAYLEHIRNAKERLELGIPYFKIHGDFHCLCLLPEDRGRLVEELEKALPEANAIRDAEFKAFNEVMARIAAECPCIDPGPPREHRQLEEA